MIVEEMPTARTLPERFDSSNARRHSSRCDPFRVPYVQLLQVDGLYTQVFKLRSVERRM